METTTVAAKPTYTVAQQAWLNFVDKVRRGEQVDPTGQYVKDGTMVPDDAEQRTRPRLDAARDQYPFRLRPDGTVVMLKTASRDGGETNVPFPTEDPPTDCPPGGCTGVPVITSTFVSSAGLGGNGDIVDMKVAYGGAAGGSISGYSILYSDLNKGAGGEYMYYYFTRSGNDVLIGKEYLGAAYLYPGLNTADPIVAYNTQTKHSFYNATPPAQSPFARVWYPDFSKSANDWKGADMNDGAGGEYIYCDQSKSPLTSADTPFHEIGILSGNSSQIQPPAGWHKWPQNLNEGAGGDYIYFCYKQ